MVIRELADEWRNAGIAEGDMVLLHSSVKRTLRQYLKLGKRVNPKIILDSFILAVGSLGTLLLPLFNLDFTKGISFDVKYFPSQMGALTEAPGVHPFHTRIGHRIY